MDLTLTEALGVFLLLTQLKDAIFLPLFRISSSQTCPDLTSGGREFALGLGGTG